jgi:hypothetical protein
MSGSIGLIVAVIFGVVAIAVMVILPALPYIGRMVHNRGLRREQDRRRRLGLCTSCGYDRRGLAADVKCPECGTAPTQVTSLPRDTGLRPMPPNPWKMENLTVLNRMAQGVTPVDEGLRWFWGLADDGRREVLASLMLMADQAKPTTDEVDAAIAASGLKPTFTPCVVLKSGPVRQKLKKLGTLPEDEWDKTIRLVLALFKCADDRRRATDPECQTGTCRHWWHAIRPPQSPP